MTLTRWVWNAHQASERETQHWQTFRKGLVFAENQELREVKTPQDQEELAASMQAEGWTIDEAESAIALQRLTCWVKHV